jgi:DNA-binding beta-propeller fold protein YncE
VGGVSEVIATANPYVGPRPFEQNEGTLFFGRDREANELFSLICAHPVVLFYSQSGAGKTSLLNAAIIPKLEEQKAEVFGVARVGGKLPRGVREEELSNVFVFNALLSLQGQRNQFRPEHLGRMSLSEYLKSQASGEQHQYFYPLHVVVFDQFEELFTSFTRRQAQQESFFVNVGQALKNDPLLRVVFAMREEYIAALDPFAKMLPGRFKTRFRLERLRADAALRAVEGPLEGSSRSFGAGVAKQLVHNLMQVPIKYVEGTVSMTGEYVEPVQLQIVCHSLWEELPPQMRVIDEMAAAEFGDVDNALSKYYNDSLRKVMEAYRDVDEKGLRMWFDSSLITPVGTRGTVYMDEGRTEDNLSERVVKMLEDRRLIRPELRGGAKWYELTHDRFIEPIRQSNKEWFALLPEAARLTHEFEQKAHEWEQRGRRVEGLLTDEELRRIQQAWERHTNLKAAASDKLREYVTASEVAFERRQQKAFRKRMILIVLAIAFGAGLLLSTIYSGFKASQAASRRRDAQIRRGELAKEFSEVKGKEYDALAFGIEAVAFSDDPPPEAVEGLREALKVIDNKVWLREGTGTPSRIELSADGKLALTVGNNEFFVWDAMTGETVPRRGSTLVGHPAPRNSEWRKVAISSDGSLVFAISAPFELEKNLSKIEQSPVSSTADSANAKPVLILDAQSGEEFEDLQNMLKDARGMLVSNDGRYILADLPKEVQIINVASRSVSRTFPLAQMEWRQIALSPDGSRLVVVYADSRVGVLDAGTGAVVGIFDTGVLKGLQRDFISFSPHGKRYAVARPSNLHGQTAVVVWDESSRQRTDLLRVRVGSPAYAAFSPDGSSIVIMGETGAAIYDVSTGKAVERTIPNGIRAQYSGTNALIIYNENGKSNASLWDALTGESRILAQTESAKYKITKAAITPDARRLITASEDNVIQVWTLGETFDVGGMSTAELLKNACRKLNDAKREYEQVSDPCKLFIQ